MKLGAFGAQHLTAVKTLGGGQRRTAATTQRRRRRRLGCLTYLARQQYLL